MEDFFTIKAACVKYLRAQVFPHFCKDYKASFRMIVLGIWLFFIWVYYLATMQFFSSGLWYVFQLIIVKDTLAITDFFCSYWVFFYLKIYFFRTLNTTVTVVLSVWSVVVALLHFSFVNVRKCHEKKNVSYFIRKETPSLHKM